MYPAGTFVDMERAKYPTSIDGLKNAGLVECPSDRKPPLIWIDGVLTYEEAEKLLPYQRVNKFPCMDYICYKSTLFEELNNMRRKHPSIVNFYPHTYILPNDFPEFQRQHKCICGRTNSAPTWVIKPKSGCCGRGIFMIQSTHEVCDIAQTSVAQQLVEPYLVDGFKFDFRYYLLISSVEPFAAYIYKEGIARFCTEPYQPPTRSNRDHQFMHFTNTAINVGSRESPTKFTRLASEVIDRIKQDNPGGNDIWKQIVDLSQRLLASIYPSILVSLPSKTSTFHSYVPDSNEQSEDVRPTTCKAVRLSRLGQKPQKQTPPQTPNNEKEEVTKSAPEPDKQESELLETVLKPNQHYFQILGIDIMIDSTLKPQLLELNDRPSLSVTVPFEKDLKTTLITEMFKHITSDASTAENCADSQWEKLFPVNEFEENYNNLRRVMDTKSTLRYKGRVATNSSITNRMLTSGINSDQHMESRKRHQQLRETMNAPRFRNYLKNA